MIAYPNVCFLRQAAFLTCLFCIVVVESRAENLRYYLGDGKTYDESIPSPDEYFGFGIGERHLQHHELHQYLRVVSRSKRVAWQEYARSHGGRPLTVMTITSPKNHKRLERIREAHLRLADPNRSRDVDISDLPAVIWMGYGVHGNEPSASNAAPIVAYHLIASRSPEVQRLLENVIVLLDPCLNPDGFERFAHWANNHRGLTANADPQHREHRELSPNGRTNYYWFDLNRDWLPLVHPESQGRIRTYHRWLPNVVLDFHEMGADATYFFQPGVPSRTHPLTPKSNIELTREFAKFHAKALNRLGSLYFTEERFDDYYMGKGSTYPDLHGAVGILFEQASARGQKQDTVNGLLEFEFAIRNQVTTSLSSLAATESKRAELHEHKRQFYLESIELGRSAAVQGYVFTAGADKPKSASFIRLLKQHGIAVHQLRTDLKLNENVFSAAESYIIPSAQPEFRFLQAMTELRREFKDKVFYDITAWSLPLAFGLQWEEIRGTISAEVLGEPVEEPQLSKRKPIWQDDDYAYLIEWNSLHAPRSLRRLLESDVRVKVSLRPFRIPVGDENRLFQPGTLIVPLGIQNTRIDAIREVLEICHESDHTNIVPVKTGLTPDGIDLGSSSISRIEKPRVALLVGTGVSDNEAGEVWHHIDRELGMPVTLLDTTSLGTTDLDKYTTIVMVSGTYLAVSNTQAEKVANWMRRGGTLIALGTSSRWLKTQKIASIDLRESSAKDAGARIRLPFADAEDFAALQKIEGTIFQTEVDLTHPIAFGLQSKKLPVFRDQTVFLEPSSSPFSTPLVYSDQPLLSGYASEENVRLASGTAAVLVRSEGAGRLIAIPNNPLFRGFWKGSTRLFDNSLFFGGIIRESTSAPTD
jgi:hypothetical protein